MSDALGPVAVISTRRVGAVPPRRPRTPSPETQRLVDDEVRRIVGDAQARSRHPPDENRARLDALASALLEHETLDEADAYEAAGVTRPQATLVGELAAAARSRT